MKYKAEQIQFENKVLIFQSRQIQLHVHRTFSKTNVFIVDVT